MTSNESPAPRVAKDLETLSIEPWPDEVVDRLGHDPRSRYVETYWLGVLGPSTVWLFRHLADRFDSNPEGFELPVADTAAALGLGMKPGRNGRFRRSLDRLCQFGLAQRTDEGMRVRRFAPPVTQGQLRRLPPHIQEKHASWQRSQLTSADGGETRARRLALTLLELGESLDAAARQLDAWNIDGPVARRALGWAAERHSRASDVMEIGGDAA